MSLCLKKRTRLSHSTAPTALNQVEQLQTIQTNEGVIQALMN
uniref:Uncharacterized protein n=1 Tax=Anguilla anguilla TaxID=7936 RepID=A0A0E9UNV1_ANGAN